VTALYIMLGIVLLVIIWAIVNYNALVRLRQHCLDSWAGIDTELKRRYDLIPNLVETVKSYARHEKKILAAVTEARTRAVASTGPPNSQAQDENVLVSALQRLFALVENYPDLKASDNYLELQRELARTENRIQAARRFYNGNVRDLNTRIEVFPSNLIAIACGFKPKEFFEVESMQIRETPVVDLG